MAKKRTSKSKKTGSLKAALHAIAASGWQSLDAPAFGFASRQALLDAIVTDVDSSALKAKADGSSVRDKLFDLFMRRFDVLQDNRKAYCTLIAGLRTDIPHAAWLACRLRASFRATAEKAGAIPSAVPAEAVIAGLKVIYAYALWAWERDTSVDLAKTMAAVDRGLGMAEKIMGVIKG